MFSTYETDLINIICNTLKHIIKSSNSITILKPLYALALDSAINEQNPFGSIYLIIEFYQQDHLFVERVGELIEKELSSIENLDDLNADFHYIYDSLIKEMDHYEKPGKQQIENIRMIIRDSNLNLSCLPLFSKCFLYTDIQ